MDNCKIEDEMYGSWLNLNLTCVLNNYISSWEPQTAV